MKADSRVVEMAAQTVVRMVLLTVGWLVVLTVECSAAMMALNSVADWAERMVVS